MYPDPITPNSYPDKLQAVDYDPFRVMPAALPPHPRVWTNGPQLARARRRIAEGSPVDIDCLQILVKSCLLNKKPPSATLARDRSGTVHNLARLALRNAMAFLLTDREPHRERALALLRVAALECPNLKWDGTEHGLFCGLAAAYDCLAAGKLGAADHAVFRKMLRAMPARIDNMGHRYCNNWNSMSHGARMSVGAALGDRQIIHDALYGCETKAGWRYGLIHTFRHDFLSDGMEWEGTMNYHMVVAYLAAEALTVLENCGSDMWHREFPSLMQSDGYDEHRGWGPKGMRSVKAMFDVFFYQMFPNGDYSNLHDQGIGNIDLAWVWWPLFQKAYEVYGDPKYAWLLHRMGAGKHATAGWFPGGRGDTEFVRLECREYPKGGFSLAKDAAFSLTGRHVNGCSLLPANGSAVLRIEPDREASPAAMVYWGPHWAGHRSPAALHVDIHAGGAHVTRAPSSGGYEDPKHLTWVRTTIAHNTVTVDEKPMFPYDFETDSLWECDRWRDAISDGVLESFQPESDFKAIRVSNDNVYVGVRLDRALLLTRDYLVDVYRVTGEKVRQYDLAMHICAALKRPAGARAMRMGGQRGYRHLEDAWRHPRQAGWISIPFSAGKLAMRTQVLLPPDAELIVAKDPAHNVWIPVRGNRKPRRRTSIIVRARAEHALFLSVWRFDGRDVPAALVRGAADSDVEVALGSGNGRQRWIFPRKGAGKVRAL